jgi:hypothetical protein
MPRFYFDLFFDRYVVLDPGGMLFQHKTGARAAAEQMAHHLAIIRSELRNGRGWIRVRDDWRNEVHRLPIDVDLGADSSPAQGTPAAPAAEHHAPRCEEDPSSQGSEVSDSRRSERPSV